MKIKNGDTVIVKYGWWKDQCGIVLTRVSRLPLKFLIRFPSAKPPWADTGVVLAKDCVKYHPHIEVDVENGVVVADLTVGDANVRKQCNLFDETNAVNFASAAVDAVICAVDSQMQAEYLQTPTKNAIDKSQKYASRKADLLSRLSACDDPVCNSFLSGLFATLQPEWEHRVGRTIDVSYYTTMHGEDRLRHYLESFLTSYDGAGAESQKRTEENSEQSTDGI